MEKMVKKSSMAAAGKEPGPPPGTQAAITAASCCAKLRTRHTSGPGNRLIRTSAQRPRDPSPTPPAGARDLRRLQACQWRVGAGLGGALGDARKGSTAYQAEGRGAAGQWARSDEWPVAQSSDGWLTSVGYPPTAAGRWRAMLRRALWLGLRRGLLGRELGTRRGGSTLGKVEGSGGYHGSGMPPMSSHVTFRTWDPWPRSEDSGSLEEGISYLPELVQSGQVYGSRGCPSQVTNPSSFYA